MSAGGLAFSFPPTGQFGDSQRDERVVLCQLVVPLVPSCPGSNACKLACLISLQTDEVGNIAIDFA